MKTLLRAILVQSMACSFLLTMVSCERVEERKIERKETIEKPVTPPPAPQRQP